MVNYFQRIIRAGGENLIFLTLISSYLGQIPVNKGSRTRERKPGNFITPAASGLRERCHALKKVILSKQWRGALLN